ncbi:MAG TPA: alpha-ketoacid dehydrogenase subunit beta [Stellaceae bacterium]|nr:alpha-ketoacid dehydrogenase subunit beta [Stellaceae bacterium]
MAEITLVQAVTLALAHAMAEDPSVLVLGEDVGADGGVFRATDGLLARFGCDRVFDTPLAEAAIAGLSIGLAAQGFHPVAEIQFTGFIYPAIDQLVNHASRLRTRTRGRLTCPMVLRSPCGGGVRAPEHHSESPEAMFAHVPGLRVVVPSSPRRAYGLLLAAIRDPDPVVFLEPTRLYRASREDVSDDGAGLPLDRCFVLREGRDATLVAWGGMVREAIAAADRLAQEGVSAEVIDVATLKPLDAETILASVGKTGRCIIAQEAPLAGGFAAEIAARVAERCLMSLLAPIERVAGFDTVMPLPRLEHLYLPDNARIAAAVRRAMAYA